jgi:cell division protein FtsB
MLVVKIILNVLLALYFIHHTISGNYGLFSHGKMDTVLIIERDSLKNMENEANRKKIRIEGLEKSNLDMDLFEEEVKRNVGIIDDNEIVILYEN